MKTLKKISIYTVLLFTLATTSCTDNDLPEADRIFRPVGLSINPSSGIGFCDVIIKWNSMPGVKTYYIEVSADSLLFAEENIMERFVTDQTEFVIPSLRRGRLISIRLRCNSDDMEHDSRYVVQAYRIPIENIFYPALSGDVKATSITVRYPQGALATHLNLINMETGEIITYPLSESDIEKGIYKIMGVSGDTKYTVEIYYGVEIRGQRQVTTAYAPSGPNVVFLPEDVKLSDVLTNADNIGKILILPEDFKDTITNTITLVGGMTIYGNPDGERASINSKIGSMFRFPPEPSGDIEFVYCNIFNERTDLDYVFNMNAAFGKVSKFALTNCRVAGFRRNFFRVQASGTGIIETFAINNCEFENLGINGDYAFMHIDVGGTVIRNISITNSTFNLVGCHFIYFGQTRTEGCKSVNIENCTFYKMMYSGSARWFINLGNVNNPENSTITLKNLILGSTVLNSTADPKPIHNGIKRENVTLTLEEVYQTNDWILQPATAPDAKVYDGKATDLFTDPEKGIFTIKDEAFAGKNTAGDPRWK